MGARSKLHGRTMIVTRFVAIRIVKHPRLDALPIHINAHALGTLGTIIGHRHMYRLVRFQSLQGL